MTPYEALERLPLLHRETISEKHIDLNGHMNVRWYAALYDDAGWALYRQFGLSPEYTKAEQAGGFMLKMLVQYLAEVHLGETVTIRCRLIGRSAKRIHYLYFMLNETTRVLASSLEGMDIHADLRTRRSSPFPPHVLEQIDALLAQQQALDWEPPLSGCMAI